MPKVASVQSTPAGGGITRYRSQEKRREFHIMGCDAPATSDRRQALLRLPGRRGCSRTKPCSARHFGHRALLHPDRPYGLGTLYGAEFDPELKRNVRFVIAETQDLAKDQLYSKERKLLAEIRTELAEGRRCQVFAVYTQKHDVTARLERILTSA